MKYSYTKELVLQFPAKSLGNYDSMIELENRLITGLGNVGEVDGHDIGSGEFNIFIRTDHPQLAFKQIQSLLPLKSSFKAAFRSVGKDDYTVLHPVGLNHFSIL